MRLAAASLPPAIFRRPSLLHTLSKALSPHQHSPRAASHLPPVRLSFRPTIEHPSSKTLRRPMTTAAAAASASASASPPRRSRSKKKERYEAPENVLRHHLDQCSKAGDLAGALRLYDAARAAGTPLSLPHYNAILYLCSSPSEDPDLDRGFEIYDQMALDSVPPNEATFTSLARLAAAKRDPDLAFGLVKRMAGSGIPPRLRSYGPALFGYCEKGDADMAREVEAHMDAAGVALEEPELAALIQVNTGAEQGGHVYRVLHRMRALVRRVSESTAEIVEAWFGSEAASEAGEEDWDAGKVKEGVAKGGGGWHGQGWLGKGRWSVGRTEMDEGGVCRRCGERLVSIDIDPLETEEFARTLSNLACQREIKADFLRFKDWLEHHGPFDAVIDGANVGMYGPGNFNFFQLNSVVNGICDMSPSRKLPLIILHSRRVKGGPADIPTNKRLLDSWQKSGSLYATPTGSNDDWYWLYAAVSCRSLLVTNDEMRDHLFELLGTSFFPRWKEKHQVRLTISKLGLAFHLPPPYSVVIQESEEGSWHVPTVTGDDVEAPRQWVCATRNVDRVSATTAAFVTG